MRYTAGYIVSRLRRKTKQTTKTKQNLGDFQNVVNNMTQGSDRDSWPNFSREWVSAQTRGGLCLVNDVTHLFFCQLEKIVRANFPQTTETLRNEDLRPLVNRPALQNQQLCQYWDQITRRCFWKRGQVWLCSSYSWFLYSSERLCLCKSHFRKT